MAVLGNLGTMFVRDKNGQMVPVPVIRGEDGGFYTPEIKDGVIRWAASRPDMPEVPDMDIGIGGGGGTPDAVQFVPQKLTDKQQAQARENIGAARTYTLKDGETIDDAPEDADIVWDPEKEGEGAGAGDGVSDEALKEVHERIDALSDEIANLQTSGLTTAQVNALDGMFKIASFTKDPTAAYSAFKVAFGIEDSGEVEPDEPDPPEVMLTSISAAYSGGDVAVGTELTELTGIVVTATYSDGTSETVTGYTLSGEIAEGSNTITVSYSGKSTTFTVTGIAESGGGSGSVVTNYSTVEGKFITSTGVYDPNSGYTTAYFEVLAGETYTVTAMNGKQSAQFVLVNSGYTGATSGLTVLDAVADYTDAIANRTLSYTVPQDGCLLIPYYTSSGITIIKE